MHTLQKHEIYSWKASYDWDLILLASARKKHHCTKMKKKSPRISLDSQDLST